MAERENDLEERIETEKRKWGFYNIGMSMAPVGLFAFLTKNPIDLWSGTFSCVCALAASVFCAIVDDERSSNKETCLFLYVGSLISMVILSPTHIATFFKAMDIVDFSLAYLLVFLLMFYYIYKIFSLSAEAKVRKKISDENQKKIMENEKKIAETANKANDIVIK